MPGNSTYNLVAASEGVTVVSEYKRIDAYGTAYQTEAQLEESLLNAPAT